MARIRHLRMCLKINKPCVQRGLANEWCRQDAKLWPCTETLATFSLASIGYFQPRLNYLLYNANYQLYTLGLTLDKRYSTCKAEHNGPKC